MKYARINDESTNEIPKYLEKGKVYEITDYDLDGSSTSFVISSDQMPPDDRIEAFCLKNGCAFLSGGNWDLFEELPETNQPKEKEL